jgi:hypothetical protein
MKIAVSAFVCGLLTLAVAAGRPDAPQIADRHLAPGDAHLVKRQDNTGVTIIISTLLDTVTRSAGTTIVISTVTANPVTITTVTKNAGITGSPETTLEVSGAVLF